MLTIGKIRVSRGQVEYYEAQVAAGAEDYYAGRGESPGRWCGRGAQLLGLSAGGQVERGGFMALMHGRSPVDGGVLRQMGARSTVAAVDLTFSAPKSVSVLFAIADDATSAALMAAHDAAVTETLSYLEREACVTRRGHEGRDRLRGEGFIAAAYRHRMSRAGDPQLHTHVVVGNVTRADGRYTALDARALYEHKSAAGALYRAVLRAEVRRRLPWVHWRSSGRRLFEIAGVDEAVLRHFSQRRVEIEQRAGELAGAGGAVLSRERMQAIALASRRAKRYGVDGGTWREQARARAQEHGLGSAELAALLRRPAAAASTEPSPADVAARLSGPSGLTDKHNTFARRHALAEIAGEFAQGATVSEVERATTDYLSDPSVQRLAPQGHEQRHTTVGLLACERSIVEGVDRRAGEGTGVLTSDDVRRGLATCQPKLNSQQAAAVRFVASSGNGIDTVTAVAGSGKTTMLASLATAYRQAGWQVLGTAPTARAARHLRETAGIPADTMHALLLRLIHGGGLSPRTVLVIDEAGMAPTRLTAQMFDLAEAAGAKVVAVGDPGQLGSIGAGGWLAAITAEREKPMLEVAIRQNDPAEQEALEALHRGDADQYLTHKREDITVHEAEGEALQALVDQWDNARTGHGAAATVMIARDNQTRELANQAARARLKEAGELPPAGAVLGGREFATGDRVITRQNDRRLDVDNGTLGRVVAVDEQRGTVVIRTDSGDVRGLDRDYVANHLEHAYALTAHGAQGGTFDWVGVIGRPDEFTREWAYTALSRARAQTTIQLIAEPARHVSEREEYAPPAAVSDQGHVYAVLRRAMMRRETQQLAMTGLADVDRSASQTFTKPPASSFQELQADLNPSSGSAGSCTDGPPPVTNPVPAEHHPQGSRLKSLDRLRRRHQAGRAPAVSL